MGMLLHRHRELRETEAKRLEDLKQQNADGAAEARRIEAERVQDDDAKIMAELEAEEAAKSAAVTAPTATVSAEEAGKAQGERPESKPKRK